MECENPGLRENFVYLVQGRSDLTNDFLGMVGSLPNILVATWDKPLNFENIDTANVFFLPNSTWAEGRNFLFREALYKFPSATYYIFCGEDVRFKDGFLQDFENELIRSKPGIAFPLCDRIKAENWYSRKEIERPIRHDQVFQAFHRDILLDGIIFPMDTTFDDVSWWLTTTMQHFLIQAFYFNQSLQFNKLEVRNSHHTLEGTSETAVSATSKYVIGDFTINDLEKLKTHINEKFGKQKPILDTIFQHKIQNKLRVKNLNYKNVLQVIQLLRMKQLVNAFKLLFKIIFTLCTNTTYRMLFPSSTLRRARAYAKAQVLR